MRPSILFTATLMVAGTTLPAATGEALWVQIAKLYGSDTNADDDFGRSVAIDGATLVVAAEGKEGGGAAYIFEREPAAPTRWREVKKLTPEISSDTNFGISRIAGDTILVRSSADFEERVAFQIYDRDAGGANEWGKTARFVMERGRSGLGVAGDTVALGDVLTDAGTKIDAGVVDLFVRDDLSPQGWAYLTTLTASDADHQDHFGSPLALSGSSLLVGALRVDDRGDDAGAAYVFERQETGTWLEVAKLLASDGDEGDEFGTGNDVDGETAIIGAGRDEDLGGNSGSAYVFERDPGGGWMEVKKLLASDGQLGDRFGISTGVSADVAVVGARGVDLPDINAAGAAYVFERNEGGSGNWGEVAKLTSAEPDDLHFFGYVVAIDANTLVVGVESDDDRGLDAGAAYLFSRTEPLLSVTGSCPGELRVTLIGATPGGPLVLLGAQSQGTTPIPVGPCAGTELALDSPKLLFTGTATSGGDLELTPEVGSGTCGRYLQALDLGTCSTSAAVQVP